MASINNEAKNTRMMIEHQQKKMGRDDDAISSEETDLMMCSSVINTNNLVALNRNVKHAKLIDVMMANPNNLVLVSDVDHQLILKIFFKDPVTVTSVSFRAEVPPQDNTTNDSVPNDAMTQNNIYSGPKIIKCYANIENLDFIDTETTNPAQEICLPASSLNGQRISLQGKRFSRCLSIQFFVDTNQKDSEFTYLNRLCLWGRVSATYALQ